MKKLLLVFLLVLGTTVTNGQYNHTLSGLTIGTKELRSMIPTTISGVPGVITPQLLNDGRAYMLTFFPSDAGKPHPELASSDGDMMRVYFEDRYNIEFTLAHDHRTWESYRGIAKKNGYTFIINISVSESIPAPLIYWWFRDSTLIKEHYINSKLISDPNIYMWFKIYRDDLFEIHKREVSIYLEQLTGR